MVVTDTNWLDFDNALNFGITVCTSGTRPTAAHGRLIFETDTNKLMYYSGSAWVEITGSGGVTDHGALTGLADDDHTQYVLVDGTRAITGALDINDTVITNSSIEINANGSGDRYAHIDFHGDDTYTDYGLRILRDTVGLNASSVLDHRGTGDFTFKTQEAADILFQTSGITRLTIGSVGNVTLATPIAMGTNKITGLAAATANGDALRYEQLIGTYLPLSGGTMTGDIVMGDNDITGANVIQATASQDLTLKVSSGRSIIFQAV